MGMQALEDGFGDAAQMLFSLGHGMAGLLGFPGVSLLACLHPFYLV